jgi:putative alpha-1,2-mannosidase
VPIYNLASPVFDRVTIKLQNGKTFAIVCKNNSKDNKYIQSVTLNGKPQSQVWIKHADVVNGGTLELPLGDTPNKELGSNPADLPPSTLDTDPRPLSALNQ